MVGEGVNMERMDSVGGVEIHGVVMEVVAGAMSVERCGSSVVETRKQWKE